MAKNISQSQIWRKILHHLNKQGLDYVLVGGAALVVHGIPRSTVDMEVYVHAEESILFAPRVIFERLLKHSTVKRDKKLSIRVASLDDMAKMKKAAGRPIDIADLRLIEEAKKLGK